MAQVDRWLQELSVQGGSDLHVSAGRTPRVRVAGALRALAGELDVRVSHEQLCEWLGEIATTHTWERFCAGHEVDFAYSLAGVARFRVNCFRHDGGAAAAFRLIPESVRALGDLALPSAVERFAALERGLVLLAGPSGSGRSSTLAALVRAIDERQVRHVITLEDPIEHVHGGARSLVTQREIGTHAATLASGLRAALRHSPDVLAIGELADRDSARLALTAAEMGVLVLAAVRASSAGRALERMVELFDGDERPWARSTLAAVLEGAVAQILLPRADGEGRCVAAEVLLRTPELAGRVRDGDFAAIEALIRDGKGQGMQTLDDALEQLLQVGYIEPEDAYQKARDKQRFDTRGG